MAEQEQQQRRRNNQIQPRRPTTNMQTRSGRPVARNQPLMSQKLWFYKQESVSIVQLLTTEGQVNFKILGGYTTSRLKKQLTVPAVFKKARQSFYAFLKKELTNVIENLPSGVQPSQQQGQTQEIKGQFFIVKTLNSSDDETELHQLGLSKIIHPNFKSTLLEIMQFIRATNRWKEPRKFYNIDNYPNLVNWAIVRAWSQEGRELLEKLYRPAEQINVQERLLDEIKRVKTQYIYNSLNISTFNLIFQEQYKVEIWKLVEALRYILSV